MAKLDKITIRGFKSIEKLEEFELGSLNVLIGANGAGKSNFVDFFRLLRAMVEQRFVGHILKYGPADGYFYNGVSHTKQIQSNLTFGDYRYTLTLESTAEGKIYISKELMEDIQRKIGTDFSNGAVESYLPMGKVSLGSLPEQRPVYEIWKSLSDLRVYHFHDTSMTAGMRRDVGVEQGDVLEPDASNFAAYLMNLREKYKDHYDILCKTLRRIAPYFDDFELRITKSSPQDLVRLTWRKKGSAYVFSPGHLSDGTIRFLCLAAVLTQPHPPTTIVLDEPELGLHPEALSVLGGLVRSASSRMQIVMATQSPLLLSEFEPEQIITVDTVDGASRFNRLDAKALEAWLNDFSVGELWQKGTIQGGVNHA